MDGLAFGADGNRLLTWTPHVPLVLAALAVSAGAYRRSRHERSGRARIIVAALLAGLLVSSPPRRRRADRLLGEGKSRSS